MLPGTALADNHGDSWVDRITIGGDLRVRQEYNNLEDDGDGGEHRTRLRARIGLEAEVEEDVTANFRFVSGGDNPISVNQTLGDGFSTKDFGIDHAFLTWSPCEHGSYLRAGKMPVPFITQNELIFDTDLSPEGGAAKMVAPIGDGVHLEVTGGAFWVEENSMDDLILYAGQAAVDADLGDAGLVVGASYFYYDNAQGAATIFDETDSFGNTVALDGTYIDDYGIFNPFAELSVDVGMPLAVFFDYALNSSADFSDEDQGFEVGGVLGQAHEAGSWELFYSYKEVEADAVIAAFTDSQFGGGGTNADGHEIGFTYQLSDMLRLDSTVFVNTIGIADGDTERDFTRVQFDIIAML